MAETNTNHTGSLTINVPEHGWTLHVAPSGHLYAFNHLTKRRTWQPPPALEPPPPVVPLPPPVPRYRVKIVPAETSKHRFRLGRTALYAVWSDAGNMFIYDSKRQMSFWEYHERLRPFVKRAEAEYNALIASLQSVEIQETQMANQSPFSEKQNHNELSKESQIGEVEDAARKIDSCAKVSAQEDEAEDLESRDESNCEDDDECDLGEGVEEFIASLKEHGVNPFSAWGVVENELPECGLPEETRKLLFDRYCEQLAKERRAAKEVSKKSDAKDGEARKPSRDPKNADQAALKNSSTFRALCNDLEGIIIACLRKEDISGTKGPNASPSAALELIIRGCSKGGMRSAASVAQILKELGREKVESVIAKAQEQVKQDAGVRQEA